MTAPAQEPPALLQPPPQSCRLHAAAAQSRQVTGQLRERRVMEATTHTPGLSRRGRRRVSRRPYYFVRTPSREYGAHDLADEILHSTQVFFFSNTVTYVLARRSYPCGRSLVITSILLSRGALLEPPNLSRSSLLCSSSAHSHTMPRRGTPPAPRTRAGSMAGRPAVMPTASDRISSATCTTPFCLLR